MSSKDFSKRVGISDVVTIEDLTNNYAFVQGVIYKPREPYSYATRKKYGYYTPFATSDCYVADCFVCDINGNHDPGNQVAVPVRAEDVGRPFRHFIKNKVEINL